MFLQILTCQIILPENVSKHVKRLSKSNHVKSPRASFNYVRQLWQPIQARKHKFVNCILTVDLFATVLTLNF